MRVVLVSDPVPETPTAEQSVYSRQLDRPWPETTKEIHEALLTVYGLDRVVRYHDLPDFIDHASEHKNDVVLPYWFGEKSRNRHGLLPAICESYGIRYLGADAFTKIVCNDKHLSKTISQNAGFSIPRGILISKPEDIKYLPMVRYPAVVKPNFEGTSLGITRKNLVSDPADGKLIALDLLNRLGEPILVEEFVPGQELSICLFGNCDGPHWIEAISWEINGDKHYLDERLFTYEIKTGDKYVFKPISMTDALSEAVLTASGRLFNSFDKVDIIRIDGRLTRDDFFVIELSPDLYLGPDGELASAFAMRGLTYVQMIDALLRNAIEGRS